LIEIGQHPQRLDMTVHAGDPVALSIPILDAAGAVVSLAGWTATAQIIDAGGQRLYDFSPAISGDRIQVTATSNQTAAWSWSGYAARLLVTATPPGGGPIPITTGWIRFYPR
jgi:hypothetical protein